MTGVVSRNIRFLLWTRRVQRSHWAQWLSERSTLSTARIVGLVDGTLQDDRLTEPELLNLAECFDLPNEADSLRYSELLPRDRVLTENLRYLFGSLARGGKKALAREVGIDPTTVSRWLNGSYQPETPSLGRLAGYFGLPPSTDLRSEPVFLSVDPVSLMERRRFLKERIEALEPQQFRELYPALKKLLEEP